MKNFVLLCYYIVGTIFLQLVLGFTQIKGQVFHTTNNFENIQFLVIEGGQGGQKQADLQLSNLSSTFTNCLFCPSLKGGALGIAANCYAATVQLEILFPNPVASLLEVKVFKKERAFSYGWREVSASLHKNVYTNAIHLRIQEMAVKDSLFILFSLPFHSSIIDAKLQLRWWEVPGDRLLAKKSSVLHPFTPTNTSVATAECISDKTYTNANYLCAVPGCNWPLNQGCWTVTDNILFYKFNITNVPVDLSITNISCSKQSDFLQVAIYPATNPQSTAPLGGPLCSAITIPLIQSNKINGQDDPLPPGAYILAIDGSSGGSCSFKFDGSLINPLEIIGTDSTVCGKPIFFTTNVKGPYTYSWAGPGGVTGNKDTLKINAPAPAHAGVYTLTVKFPNGCEMKATHTLKVSTPPEAPTVTNNSTVPCGQQVCFTVNMPSGYAPAQFQWQAAGWSSTQKEPCRQGGANIAGTYSLTVTYAPGCSRTVTSVVTVSENFTPLPTVTHNYQNCDQTQICFTVSGVTGPATYRLIGPGSTPCSPNWSSPPSASNTICRNQLVLGNYGVEVTLANGCKATVSVSPSMQPPSHSIPNGECGPNTTLTFTVSYNDPNASHTWCNFIGWQSTDKDVTIGPPVTYGLYCLHYKYKNCIQRYCKEVSQQLPAITVNADPLACGQDLILTASGIPNATYTWSGPNNWTATGTPVTRPKPTAGGAYTVVAQNQTGTCSRTVNLKNPTIPTPTINFEGNFCSGTLSLSVTPSGYDSLKWSGPAGFSSKAFNPQIPNVQSSMSGVYTVEAFMGHCKITRTKNIQIQPLPLPNVAISPSICEGQALSFTTTNLLPGATYTWVKGTDTVSKAPNFTITPAKFSDNGTYTLVVQKTGCVRTKNYLVEVKPTPKDPSWIITNSPICEGQTLLITASKEDGATEYIWKGPGDWQSITQNDITSTIHNSRPNLSLAHAGTYSLAVQVNGCTSGFSTFGVVVMNNPSTPSAADVTRCGPGVATFTASSIAAIPFDVVSLYTTPTGGIAHQTDTQAPFELSSPPVTTETTFYLEAYSTATTCYSSTRKPVVVKILEVPGQPSAQSITQCAGSGVVIFTATMGTPPGTTIHLYTSSNATDPVFSDSNSPYHLSYSISNVNQVTTSTLYIRAEKAGCFSPIANFNLTLIPSPGPPIVNSVRRCGDGSVTFTIQFGNPSGTVIRIFTIPCQNTAIDSTLANNGTFQTPVLVSSLNSSVTYTYYFQAVDYAYGCRSECVSSSAIIDPLPTPPSGQNISRCGEGTLTFTVTASPIVSTIHFYTQSTGGNPITTVSAAPYTYTTPVLSQSTTYYVEALTNNGCRSTQRTPVVASINPLPGPPTINSVARCGGGTVTFTFSNFNNSIYRLYTVASGGNAISTAQGNSFTVGPVAQTQTFYVERTDPTTLCTSLRSEVVATIHTVPGEPSVEPVSRCQAGNVTFTARMGTPAGSRIRIYTSASATSPLQSQVGPLAQFPILLNTTTTYYFSAFDDATGCESARTSAVATISPNPNAPVAASFQRCGAGSVTISFTIPNARSGDKIMVYSNAALSQLVTESSNLPFNFTTPQLTQNTTYYLRATNTTSNCISEVSTVTIQILPIPAAPIVTDLTRCGGGNLELSFAVVDPAAKQVILYTDNQTSLPLRIQDLPSTTLPLGFQQASTTYYLSVRDKNTTCESVRVPFTITIHPIPAPPQLRAIASCGPGEVSIDITPVAPFADSYKVLDNTFQPLSALNASPWRYTTNLTTTTDFWVEAIITATGCKSNPIKITAPVYPIPPQPVIENLQRCGPGTLTFTAQFNTLLANTLLIYTQPSGADSPIQTINTFPYQYTTRTLSSTTTFYASLSNSATGCVSSRVPFIATVFALPGAPKVMENSRCGSGVISFVAEMGNPEGTAIQFYNGSNLVESKSNSPFVFSTFVETTTSFSFESIDGVTGCKSQRVTVVGTVHPIPAPPLGIARSSCQSSEVTLKFEMGVPAGNLIELYDASYSLLQVLTSPFQVSLPLNATTTYYAKSKQTSTGCVSSEFVLPVRSLTYATPATANAVERCGAGDVTFTLNTTPGHIYRVYDTPFGGQVKAQTTASQPEVTVLNITRTQTFFVESVHPQRDCPSARLPIVAYVHPAIGAPQASGVNRCGEGPVVITAVMGDPPGTAMRLYTQAQGGAPIANINNGNFSFALSSITTNMAYYLEAYDEGTGCISSRTKVEVTVLPIPPAPSSATVQRCGAGPVTFTVVSTQPVFLYNTEGTLITRDLTQPYWLSVGEIYQNQTYYVEAVNIQTGCKSPKIEVVAQLLPIPSAPLVEGNKRCGPGIVTFTVSQADFSITSIRIYNQVHSLVASGDAPLIYTTSSLQTSTLYYVSSFNGSCESEKIPVRAVLHPIPSPPVARSQSFCSGDISNLVLFTARMGNIAGTGIRLFSQAEGGNAIATSDEGPLFILPVNVSGFSTTTYYVEAFDVSSGCISGRSPVSVSVHPLPSPPPAINVSRCGPGEVRFTIPAGNYDKINLYKNSSDAAPIQSKTQFPAEFVNYESQDVSYFLETESLATGCKSERLGLRVVIYPVPSTPQLLSNSPVCEGQNLKIQVQSGVDVRYEWKGPNGFTATGAVVELNPASASHSGIYEVVALNNYGCLSPPAFLPVNVISIPSTPTVTYYRDFMRETPLCEGDELNLAVLNYPSYAEGTQFEWKGPANFRAFPHPFPGIDRPITVAHSGTYYVRAIIGQCSSAYGSIDVMVHPKPIKPVIVSNSPLCKNGDTPLTLTIQNPQQGVTYHWAGPANFHATGINHIRESNSNVGGIYSVQAITEKGCTSDVVTHTVTLYEESLNAIPIFTPKVCQGESIQIEVPLNTSDALYEWVLPSGDLIINNRNKFVQTDAQTTHAGVYQVRVKLNGCYTPFVSIPIEVFPAPNPPTIVGPSQVCQRDRLIFTAQGTPEEGVFWQIPGVLRERQANILVLNSSELSSPGIFTLQVQARNTRGCSSAVVTHTFEVLPIPNPPTLLVNRAVCKGDSVIVGILNPSSLANYVWQVNISNTNILNFNSSITFVAEKEGNYIVTARAVERGCTSLHASTIVEVIPIPPSPRLPSQYQICPNTSVVFQAQATNYDYLLWKGPGQLNAQTQDGRWEVNNPLGGEYLVWAVQRGCTSAVARTRLFFREVPMPSIISSSTVCEGEALWLTANNSFAVEQYIWQKPNGAQLATTVNSVFIGSAQSSMGGVYSLAIVVGGCTSSFVPHAVAVISNPPLPAISSNTTSVCIGDILRLTAQTTAANAEFRWNGPAGFSSSLRAPNLMVTGPINAGFYEAYVITGQCTSSKNSIYIEVVERPQAPEVLSNISVCEGQTLRLHANSNQLRAQFHWRGPSNFEQEGQLINLPNVKLEQSGNYSVVVVVNACTSLPSVISVNVQESPRLTDLLSNSPLCSGESLNLVTQLLPGAQYFWKGPEWGPISVTSANYTLSSNRARGGVYSVFAVVNGCTSNIVSTQVEVGTKPPTPIARTNAPICSGQGLVLMASTIPNVRYYWQGPGANELDVTLQNPTIAHATTAHSGVYSVVAIQGACTSNPASVTVQVNPKPMPVYVATNAPLCAGETLRLTASYVPGAIYNWTGPSTGNGSNFASHAQNPVLQNVSTAQSGTYNVFITQNGCNSEPASVYVLIKPRPVAPSINTISPLCQGQNLELNTAALPNHQYFWTGPSGFVSTNATNTIANITSQHAGVYSLVVVLDGCSSSIVTQSVSITPAPYDFSSQVVNWCSGRAAELSAPSAPGYRFMWMGPAGFSANSPNVILPMVTARNQGVYQLFAELNNCRFPVRRVEAIVQNCNRELVDIEMLLAPVVYPNPSNGWFYLNFYRNYKDRVSGKITLLDISHRTILEQNFEIKGRESYLLDLSSFSPGMYWLKCELDEKVYLLKLIKE